MPVQSPRRSQRRGLFYEKARNLLILPSPKHSVFFHAAACCFVAAGAILAVNPCYPQTPKQPSRAPGSKSQRVSKNNDATTPDAVRERVIALTNAQRAKYGLPTLVADALLMRTAQAHAEDMKNNGYFDHTDLQGGAPWDRTRAAGYPLASVGENIAMGQRSPNEVMNSWMDSDGHRANILNGNFQAIGVGVIDFRWVQVFGSVITRVATADTRRNESASPLAASKPSLPPTAQTILADFDNVDYKGWELSGNCWGRGPEGAAFAGTVITGWAGRGFATTAHPKPPGGDPSGGTGRALSAPFTVPADAIALRFKIAGGHYPSRCCLNLLVDGKTVRSETAASPYAFQSAEWDLSGLRGKTARLEIVDAVPSGAHAYIHVDDITLIRRAAAPRPPSPVLR